MRNYIDEKEIMARAYLGLAEEALKKGEKRKDNVMRCCKCGRCDVTLKKLSIKPLQLSEPQLMKMGLENKTNGVNIYACTRCINEKIAWETTKEFEKRRR